MFSDLRYRVRALFRRRKMEAELDEELRFHLQQQIEKELAHGARRDNAERRANLRFGMMGSVKEECREARGISAIETTVQDLRYGLRGLRRSPGFTTVALLLLALGIGANTAVFTVARQVLLRGLAVDNARDLVQLKYDDLANHIVATQFSYPAFQLFSRPNPLLSGVYARSEPIQVDVRFRGASGLARAVFESPGAGVVLGITPALGRLLNEGDAKSSGESPPVILSHAYWQRRFGGDASVIGKLVSIDTLSFVIAGVTRANFHGVEAGIDPEITLPAYTADAVRGIPTTANRASWGFIIIARRAPAATPEKIRASLEPQFSAILSDVVAAVPAATAPSFKRFTSNLRLRVEAAPLGAASRTRDDLRQPLTILIVITGLVFIVTCANLAGMILARTESRTSEIGIRLAIGCSRRRVLRQLLTESALVAIFGAVFGVLAAVWTGPMIPRLLGTDQLAATVEPDAVTLGYGLALAVVGGVLLGLIPALRAARLDPLVSIRHSSTATGFRGSAFARTLIICEVAVSLVLSLTAGQFIRSLQNYMGIDPGFRADHLAAVSVRPDLVKYPDARKIAYSRQMYARLAALPGVKSVTFSTGTIGQLTWNTLVSVPGYQASGTASDSVGRNIVGPRFVETLGLSLLAGRDFDTRDNAPAPATVIVNESFARRYFRKEFDAGTVLGRHFSFIDSPKRRDTIIGIVRDARDRGVREPAKPVVYSNYEHDPLGWLTFTVRTQQDPKTMLETIVSVIQKEDSQVPIDKVRTVRAQIDQSLERERVLAGLSALLGTLSTVIAMIGLYGLLAYSVTRRTREIGIRMALGARPDQVRLQALRESGFLLLLGCIAGCPGYMAVSRLLRAQIYNVTPADPAVMVGAISLLAACAALATYIPAAWCAKVNPAAALKYE